MKHTRIIYASQNIQCGKGLLGNIKNILSKLSKGFTDFIDDIAPQYGIEVKSQTPHKDGSMSLVLTINTGQTKESGEKPKEAGIHIAPTDENGVVDLTIKGDYGNTTIDGLLESEVQPFLLDYFGANKNGLNSTKNNAGELAASKNIKVKLSKIQSNKGYDIELHSILASKDLDILDAMDAVNDVIEDEEFVNELSEEPKCFDLQLKSDEDLEVSLLADDVITVEELNNTMIVALYEAIRLHANLKTIHWNASGVNFFDLHEKLDEYIDVIYDQIDVLGELVAELSGCAPNPGDIPTNLTLLQITNTEGFNAEEGFTIAYNLIDEYIQVLQTIYCNFPSDIQSTLDEMIRYWKKESHYKLDRLIH